MIVGTRTEAAGSAPLRLNRAIALVVLLEVLAIFLGAWLMTRVMFVSLSDVLVPDQLRTIWNTDYSSILNSKYPELAGPASSMRKYLWWSALTACCLNVVIVASYQALLARQSFRGPAVKWSKQLANTALFSFIAFFAGYGVFLTPDVMNVRGLGLSLGGARDGLWWLYLPLTTVVLVLSLLYVMTNLFSFVSGGKHVWNLRP